MKEEWNEQRKKNRVGKYYRQYRKIGDDERNQRKMFELIKQSQIQHSN